MKLTVNEIFYSLQGEGARVGTPTIFVRLTGCSAKYACYQTGVKCDTEFESGREMNLNELLKIIQEEAPECKEITWTGGEPADQLNEDVVKFFKDAGYYQAIETSGIKKIPELIDFVCISPKVAEHVIKKNFPDGVNELRYVRHKGQGVPSPLIKADHYWISPHNKGMIVDSENLYHCIELCKKNPIWKLSTQVHKTLNIL